MSEEFATPTASAETTESEPVTTETVAVNDTESAPVDDGAVEQTTETVGSEPSKTVKELIALRKRAQQAEQQAEYYRGMAEARVKPEPPAPVYVPPAPVHNSPPVLDDFETYEAWQQADREYVLAQAEQRIMAKFKQTAQAQQQQTVYQKFNERISKAAESNPILVDIMKDATFPAPTHVAAVIHRSENAPEILMYLHNNRKEAQRIAQLDPVFAARELGMIEAQLKFKPAPPPPKTVSQAPEPINTLSPSGAVKEFNPETASMEEYYARRMDELKLNRRR